MTNEERRYWQHVATKRWIFSQPVEEDTSDDERDSPVFSEGADPMWDLPEQVAALRQEEEE